MNVVITLELYRLARCAASKRRYTPLLVSSVCRRAGVVYLCSAALAASIWYGGDLLRAGANSCTSVLIGASAS